MRALVLLLVLALSLTLLGVQAGAPCSPNGVLDGAYCNCYAGTAPSYASGTVNCDSTIPSGTCTGTTDGDFTTGMNAPVLDDVTLANDRLIVTFKQPVVPGAWSREKSNIHFFSDTRILNPTPQYPTCSYPGSMWTKTVNAQGCEDIYTFSMPWSSSAACGFTKTATWSTLTYNAAVRFIYEENGAAKRTLSNNFNLNIQIARQKEVTAALNLQLDSSSAAIVSATIVGSSAYDLVHGKSRVLIQTRTSWPYKVSSPLTTPSGAGPQLVTAPTNTVVTIGPDALTPDNCPTTPNSVCVQQFEVIISGTNSLCDFFGDYVFSTQLVCSDVGTCAEVAGPNITVSLDHTNVCATPTADTTTSATQTLDAFGDDSLANAPQTSFETGDTSYWSFAVVDPNVSIDSVTLSSVILKLNVPDVGSDNVYLSSSNFSPAFVNKSISTTGIFPPGSKAVVSFGIRLSRDKLPNTVGKLQPGASIKQMTIDVVVDVAYHGNNKKRMVASAEPVSDSKGSTANFVVRLKADNVVPAPAQEKASNCTGYACKMAHVVQKVLSVLGF